MKKLFLLMALYTTYSNSQIVEQWAKSYNGLGEKSDISNDIASDASGNVYVTGYTYTNGQSRNIITIKYDNTGAISWSVEYNSLNNGLDEGNALAVDVSGNVYVAGVADNGFILLKYNSSGTLQWEAMYGIVLYGNGEIIDLAVSGVGNIYVLGTSDSIAGTGRNDDMVLVKYNFNGGEQWDFRYDRNQQDDRAIALVLDNSENIHITGRSSDGTFDDIATLKVDKNGTTLWEEVYDDSLGLDDDVTDIVVDINGNVYVCGQTDIDPDAVSIDDDALVIKYNSTGMEQWVSSFDNGTSDKYTSITVDNSGNVYITGSTLNGTTDDYLTVKLNSAGSLQWSKSYDGSASQQDDATNVVLDQSGNIYVTGKSDLDADVSVTKDDYVTIKYDTSGNVAWTKSYNGIANGDDEAAAMYMDLNDNLFITGNSYGSSSQRDILTLQYNSAGTEAWATVFSGTGINDDGANDVVADNDGNIYATGFTTTKDSDRDILTIKFNSNGDTLWTRSFTSLGELVDEGNVIAIDASGNIYVAGTYDNNFITLKYNSNGNLLWSAEYNPVNYGGGEVRDIEVDASGNVYITGEGDAIQGAGNNDDIVIAKYNSSGVEQWVARYDNGYVDYPVKLGLDTAGNIYVAGTSANSLDDDYVTLKYNSNGVQQWAKRFNSNNGNDLLEGFAMYNNSEIVVTGRASNGSDNDVVTIKYDTDGNQKWLASFNGGSSDRGRALTTDNSRNIYVAASSRVGSLDDFLIIKYDNSGNQKWVDLYDYAGDDDDPASILVNNDGYIFICGEVDFDPSTTAIDDDIATLRYTPWGEEKWSIATFKSQAGISEAFSAMAIGSGTELIIAGETSTVSTQSDFLVIQYDSPTAIVDLNFNQNRGISVYPNPFNTKTFFNVSDANQKINNIYIFDLAGKKVLEFNEIKKENFILQTNNLKGMYFYKAVTDQTVFSGTLIAK